MLRKMFAGAAQQKAEQKRADLYRNLMRHEAKIGGQLFGNIPAGGRREFFCLDEHTWVWHEEWVDKNGEHQTKTTRYDVRPDGILKSQNGHYQKVSPDEARRLHQAAKMYQKRVSEEIYDKIA